MQLKKRAKSKEDRSGRDLQKLRRLGKVLHVSRNGLLILRTDKTPPIGARVVDININTVGFIIDVFGPVKEPYVAVRPQKGIDTLASVGQILYMYGISRKDK